MALFTLKWPQVVLLTLPVNPVKVPFSGNAGDLFMILHHHGRGWGKDIYLSTFNAQTCSLAFALFVSLGALLNVFNAPSCTISDCYYFFSQHTCCMIQLPLGWLSGCVINSEAHQLVPLWKLYFGFKRKPVLTKIPLLLLMRGGLAAGVIWWASCSLALCREKAPVKLTPLGFDPDTRPLHHPHYFLAAGTGGWKPVANCEVWLFWSVTNDSPRWTMTQ